MTDLHWPILQWTENLPPDEDCRYDHCLANTPFGRFLITWKSWKEYNSPTVDETPWGDFFGAYSSLEKAKAACQQAMNDRLEQWVCAPSPPAEREIEDKELLRAYALGKSGYCYEGPDDDWPLQAERAATVAGIRAAIASCRSPVSQSTPSVPTVKDFLTDEILPLCSKIDE